MGTVASVGSLSAPTSPPCRYGVVPFSRTRVRHHPPDSMRVNARSLEAGGQSCRWTLACSRFKYCSVLKWKHFGKKSVFLLSLMRSRKPHLPSEWQWAGEAWRQHLSRAHGDSSAGQPRARHGCFNPACPDLGPGLGHSCCVALSGCY